MRKSIRRLDRFFFFFSFSSPIRENLEKSKTKKKKNKDVIYKYLADTFVTTFIHLLSFSPPPFFVSLSNVRLLINRI